MSTLRSWLANRARAIDESPVLRVYAVVLSLLHALTGAAWITYKNIASLVTGEDAVCWPLLPECERLRTRLSPGFITFDVALYIVMGLTAAALFAKRRTAIAFVTFLAATLLAIALYALDYRLRSNQTYMFGAVVIAFSFAPRNVRTLQILIALFYFWAGTLKIGREWTSGAALYAKPYFVPETLIPAACVYVLILEILFVWGLFAKNPALRWAVYGQLVLFHVVSFGVVGWFYPLLMFGLGAIYPLVWLRAPDDALTFRALLRDRVVIATVAIFSAFQLVPLFFPGDTAITGEGRLFALHMFDAKVECAGGAILTSASGQRSRALLINDHGDTRTKCDPIVLVAQANRLCRILAAHGDSRRVDVAIDARRASDPTAQPLIHVGDFCHRAIVYSVWHHNAWLASGQGG